MPQLLFWHLVMSEQFGKTDLFKTHGLGSFEVVFSLLIEIIIIYIQVSKIQIGKTNFKRLFARFYLN